MTCRTDSEAAFDYGRLIFVNQIVPSDQRKACFMSDTILNGIAEFLLPSESKASTFYAVTQSGPLEIG